MCTATTPIGRLDSINDSPVATWCFILKQCDLVLFLRRQIIIHRFSKYIICMCDNNMFVLAYKDVYLSIYNYFSDLFQIKLSIEALNYLFVCHRETSFIRGLGVV